MSPQKSHYYKCIDDHFEELEQVYDDRFAKRYGFFRPYVSQVIYCNLYSGNRVSLMWEIHMLGLTRRGLKRAFEYRASLRPYPWERGGEIPLCHPPMQFR